ncbi:LuxR family transcriptional regulator [Citrobacter koseri]|uniref:hypothetical protein n=1 Tax=Citrobacter koseri TaxID=545 RepID=UPI000E15C8B2|nr:hypothetical protein [Citrobacter koseri]SUX97241.1 LuxR family transcriptional regulator [Citrobacter koseri]
MIVISENSFFHLGVSALVERMALNTTRNLIVFDTGRDCLYMLDTEEAKMPFFHEPILIFSHCRRIYLTEKKQKIQNRNAAIKNEISSRCQTEARSINRK